MSYTGTSLEYGRELRGVESQRIATVHAPVLFPLSNK